MNERGAMQHFCQDLPRRLTREMAIAGILVLLSGLLVFPNLGATCLWEDEAQTAIVAQNILVTGLPTAFVGKNFVSILSDHSDIRDNIYIWQPWLPNYLAAGSMAIFGENSFGARFPFAFMFVILIPVSYFFFKKSERDYANQALMAAILLAGCAPLLLHARQCRYYMLVPLLNVLMVDGYRRFMAEPRLKHIIVIAIWATALFNSFPPGAILLAMAIVIDLLRRRPSRKIVRLASAGFLLCIVINLPVFVFCSDG